MKKIYLKLMALALLSVLNVTNAGAGNSFTSDGSAYLYFNKTLYPSGSGSTMDFSSDDAVLWVHVWGGTCGDHWYEASPIEGDIYGAKITNSGYFTGCQIARKNPNGSNAHKPNGNDVWNYTADYSDMSTTTNYRHSTGWGKHKPTVNSFTLTPSGFTNLGGSGTYESPYLVLCGAEITFTASSVSGTVNDDSNMTLNYDFKEDDSTSKQKGSTNYYTYTASSTAYKSFSMKVYAYNNYQSEDGTSASQQIYFKTIKYYVSGNGTGNWCDGKSWTVDGSPMTYDASSSKWQITFDNVAASNDLQFAITDGTWDGSKSGGPWKHSAYNSSCSTNVTETDAGDGNNNNVKLSISDPSNITITFTPSGSNNNICASAEPLYNNLAVTVSPSGAAADPTISTTYVPQATNSVSISAANANDGYTWSEWTANGGTITTSSSQSTTWSPGASSKTATANYTENNYVVTVTAGDGGTVDAGSVTGHVSTPADLPDATPYVGYRFVNWTVSGATITNATSATEATINGMTSDVTVSANFERVYAYVEGRFQVNNAARNSITYTSTENTYWSTSSRNIQFGYDETNHRFKLHTYMKPADLSAKLSSNTQFFSIKTTSTLSSTFENEVLYTPASTSPTTDQELSTAGGKKAATSSDNRDDSFYFTSSDATGYAILYFDQSDVWYELEHTLTYDGNGNTSGSVSEAYYDHNATATVVAAGTFLRTGYTLTGWSGSDGNTYASGASITMTQNLTLTAQWSEDKHSVTVVKDLSAGGTISTTSVSGIGIDTYSGYIIATANTGYYFSGWTLDDGVTQHSLSTTNTQASSTSSITINATADSKTLTANFGVRYAIFGSLTDGSTPAGLPGWSTPLAFDAYDSENSKYTLNLTELHPNTVYKLKVKDLRDGNSYGPQGESHIPDGAQWTLDGTVNTGYALHFKTKGVGTYVLTTTETGDAPNQKPTAKIDMPTSYTVTYGQVTDNGQNGGSISTVVDNGGYALSSGDYVAAAGSATFNAGTPTTGYSFIDWRTSSTFGQGDQLSTANPWTLSSPTADQTVYAHYAENLCTVTITANNKSGGSITVGGEAFTWGNTTRVGVDTKYTLVATPATGYYFAGWTLSVGADCSIGPNTGEDYPNVTLTGLGDELSSTATLTANFQPLEKVYFRNWNADSNEPLWENVYVYFSTGVDGSGNLKSNSSEDYYTQMTLESGNVYGAYVPRGTTRNIATIGKEIAFSNNNFGANTTFSGYEGVMRSDYVTGMSLFVPRHASTETLNNTKYYKGYWKHHNLAPGALSGYSIERYKGGSPAYEEAADNGADNVHFIVEDDNTIRYSLRVDNVTADYNNYMIYSDGGIHYITYNESPAVTGYTITTSNYSRVHMSEYTSDNPRFYITPTTQNLYTLTIDMSGDEMLLTVDYPVAVGDYRIVHTYSSTKKAYSDIIKSADAASGVTASMYINTTNATSLTLEKCTAASSSVIWTPQTSSDVWSSYSSNFTEGNGVYQFDVTINKNASDDGSTISNIQNIKIYEGEFYIKTDCAPGGWTAWKANVMEKNTITFNSADSKTFDRSFCHWIDAVRDSDKPMNVKCVIANDYNIAVSDTLVGDAILGKQVDGVTPWENIPAAANVRFSYNSTTNELKRTYLSLAGENKLQLEGNTVSSASMIRNTNGTTFTNNATTLTALSNFTYKVDVQAREKARVRLTSIYQSNNQSLVGTFTSTGSDLDGADNAKTVEVLGGNTSNTGYKTMRIIYDFKTNYVMAAWLVDADVNVDKDTALQADLMIIRQEQRDAYQLTFGTGKSMTAVKKVYGVMKFTKPFITDATESPYARGLYWISFPFNVRLSDAFGMGTYGTHWIIEYYDGKERAQNGFWADSEGFWKYVTPYQRDSGFVMKANVGYVLALDLDELDDESLVWDNGMKDAYLYFPSSASIGNIQNVDDVEVPIDQDGYQCTIGPRFEGGDDRRVKDSYWHIIGVPSYANTDHTTSSSEPEDLGEGTTEPWAPDNTLYFYDWNSETNTYTINSSTSYTFKPMHSYMVQYGCTTLTWTRITNSNVPARIAVRVAETTDYNIKLSLLRDDEEQDRTLLRMTNDVNATNRFEFNYDICKEYNGGRANIWTVTADTVEVAGNCLPTSTQTTVIPVGVKVVANGDYTFSIPDGTSGVNVTLVDTYANTRTSLSLIDYTTYLTTGTHEGRFLLEIAPISQMPTELENAANANANAEARKVFVGGRLYILRDGKAYDATGAQVR